MSQLIIVILAAGILVTFIGIVGSWIYVVSTRRRVRQARGVHHGKG